MNETLFHNFQTVLSFLKEKNPYGETVTLVCATKTVPEDVLREAKNYGLKIAADNKVQEFRDKTSKIDGLTYHFIGRLQKNKVKYLIGKVALIHSVDSLALAEEISRLSVCKGVETEILLEVNVSGEESKAGFPAGEVENALESISRLPAVKAVGLMTMLPEDATDREKEEICLQTRKLYDIMKEKGFPFSHLSMGMSGDYRIAVRAGSNMVRIGSALFGKRNYGKKPEDTPKTTGESQ